MVAGLVKFMSFITVCIGGVPPGSRLGVQAVVLRKEAPQVLEDVLLWAGQGCEEVPALCGRQQLHQALYLMDPHVLGH